MASDIGHSGYRQSDTTFLKPHGIFLDTGICGGESYAFNGFPVYVRLLASDNGGMMSVSGVKIIHGDCIEQGAEYVVDIHRRITALAVAKESRAQSDLFDVLNQVAEAAE